MNRNPLVALILTAFTQMAVASAKFNETAAPKRRYGRSRIAGPRQPAGNKLARKAAERRLGLPSGRRGLIVDGR